MGSFVPFGGFFPTQDDFKSPLTTTKQPFIRCNTCDEKYKQELSSILKEGSSVSIADKYSESLPSWLQRSDSDPTKGGAVVPQVKDVKAASNEQILELHKKWNEHCRYLHQIPTCSSPSVPFVRPQAPQHKVIEADLPKKALEPGCGPSERERSASRAPPICNLSLTPNCKPAPTVSVATDLGLGTIDASKVEKLKKKKPLFQDERVHLQHSPGTISFNRGIISKKDSEQIIAQSCSHASVGVSHASVAVKEGFNASDYKPLLRKLCEAVEWQVEAISRISEVISSCRSGNGHQNSANRRGNIWLSFHGPDKIGKRRVSEALADALFGSIDHLIAVDLSSQDKSDKANSLFFCRGTHDFDGGSLSRIKVVDHIAQELRKKAKSIVFLENIDEADADPLVQNSLSHAIQTGKFQDSRGREISVNNVIVIATCSTENEGKSHSPSPRKEFIKFPEEKILEAKNWQMQVTIRHIPSRSNITRASLVSEQGTPKRKALEISESYEYVKWVNKTPKKHSLDLNLPLEEEEANEVDSSEGDSFSDNSKSWVEDFYSRADGNVVFKPFDFDALADKFLTKIRVKFEEIFSREKILLEINNEVMVQILAAAWCAENKAAVEEWIENVLVLSLVEARERFRVTEESVVRLAPREGVPVNEWVSGIRLPRSVKLSI